MGVVKLKYFIWNLILITSMFSSVITVCQDCHGKNFENRALGRSKIVKNMSKKDIVEALKNFKNSKSIMKSYSSRLNDKQIRQIANIFGK